MKRHRTIAAFAFGIEIDCPPGERCRSIDIELEELHIRVVRVLEHSNTGVVLAEVIA